MSPEDTKDPARILLFTGDGKGKTTAALGMVLRASGHGQKVLVLQFIKSDSSSGEVAACKKLSGIKLIQTGRGFVPAPDSPDFAEHRRAAERGLKLAVEALKSREYNLVILDEICTTVARGLLAEERVMEAIRQAHPDTCVVLTGRNATPGLASLADTLTEMRCIKHAFISGRKAQKGVEY